MNEQVNYAKIQRIQDNLDALVIGQFGTGFCTDAMLYESGIKATVANHTSQLADMVTYNVKHLPSPLNSLKCDGVTDDTTNFQALLDYLKAQGSYVYNRYVIVFPVGISVIGNINVSNMRNVVIKGQGKYSTQLLYNGSGSNMFSFDTFTTTPANYAQGTAQGVKIENLSIRYSSDDNMTNIGSRTKTAIQDNGNGGFEITDVLFRGFKYAFSSPYCSDFTHIERCDFYNNDVGIYLGIASQQYTISECNFSLNNEDIVLENACHGEIDNCYFIDARISNIDIEVNANSRYGVATNGAGQLGHQYQLSINNCWFETGSGYNTGWDSPYHIITQGSITNLPRHIKVKNCVLVSSDAGMGTKSGSYKYSFWKHTTGKYNILENLLVFGNRIDCVVDMALGIAQPFIQQNTKIADGYTVPLWNNLQTGCIEKDVFNNSTRFANDQNMYMEWINNAVGHNFKLSVNADDTVLFSTHDGTAYRPRITLDIINSKILLGTYPNGRSISFSTAAPVAGTYQAGSIVYNSTPTVGQPKGWQCTVTGTPGTWASMGNL